MVLKIAQLIFKLLNCIPVVEYRALLSRLHSDRVLVVVQVEDGNGDAKDENVGRSIDALL